jgi:DNA-binding CsgD family transcriptional regulator
VLRCRAGVKGQARATGGRRCRTFGAQPASRLVTRSLNPGGDRTRASHRPGDLRNVRPLDRPQARYRSGVVIDVVHLSVEAERLGDLTARERAVLPLILEGLGSREIAERLGITESLVYLTIADLLRALEFAPPVSDADDIHARAGTRPAAAVEIGLFHEQFGPFASDDEG